MKRWAIFDRPCGTGRNAASQRWTPIGGGANAGAAYVFTGFCPSCPRLTLAQDGGGGYVIRDDGIAGFTYQLQRAPNVTDPWTTNATITASISGPLEFHDTTAPPGPAFYRVVQD